MRIRPEKSDLLLHLAMRDFTCEYCQRSPPWCYIWQCEISHANTAREVRLVATFGNARFHMRIMPEKSDLMLHLAMRDFTCEYCQRSPPCCYIWQCEISHANTAREVRLDAKSGNE
ncbi:hypothetical protein BgiBS90_032295 [Biomphalaria glabrata]|nr:hypothetical protein BgiBS90_032295 [Biomphalaria glabrata]